VVAPIDSSSDPSVTDTLAGISRMLTSRRVEVTVISPMNFFFMASSIVSAAGSCASPSGCSSTWSAGS